MHQLITKVPTAGSDVTVASNEKVLLDIDFPSSPVNSITINGILVFSPQRNHNIATKNIMISGGGQLWIGSEGGKIICI